MVVPFISAPEPFVDLTIGGHAAGMFLGGSLQSFTYRDVHHGEVDDIGFTLADGSGLWRSSWAIDHGTEISALIGYKNGVLIPCGLYAVDEDEASGDGMGDRTTFRALAAFTSKDLRTDRSEAYDDMSLKAIVEKTANRHGLQVIGTIPEISFKRISQNKESDLVFLTRMAEDWGCYFSVKGNRLVFVDRKEIEEAAPVRSFDLIEGTTAMRYRLRTSSKKRYKDALAKYLNPKDKRILEVRVADPRVLSGDTLKLDDKMESQVQADRFAWARLAGANDQYQTCTLTVVGDPLLLAGQVVALGTTFGKYAGSYLTTVSEHGFSTSGYKTTLQLKRI